MAICGTKSRALQGFGHLDQAMQAGGSKRIDLFFVTEAATQ